MTIPKNMENAQCTCLPAACTKHTSSFDLHHNCWNPSHVLAEDLSIANLREGSPNVLQMASKCVGKQATSELTDSCSAGEQGGTKNNQASSWKPRVFTTHSNRPGSSGGAAGGSSRDPNELRQEVSIWP